MKDESVALDADSQSKSQRKSEQRGQLIADFLLHVTASLFTVFLDVIKQRKPNVRVIPESRNRIIDKGLKKKQLRQRDFAHGVGHDFRIDQLFLKQTVLDHRFHVADWHQLVRSANVIHNVVHRDASEPFVIGRILRKVLIFPAFQFHDFCFGQQTIVVNISLPMQNNRKIAVRLVFDKDKKPRVWLVVMAEQSGQCGALWNGNAECVRYILSQPLFLLFTIHHCSLALPKNHSLFIGQV